MPQGITFPDPQCVVVVQFLLSRINRLSTVSPFSACWFEGMGSPNSPSDNPNFQFSGIIVASPGGSIPPFGTNISRPAEPEGLVDRKQKFCYWTLGVIMLPIPFPPCDSWTCESWQWEKYHHILDTDSEHIQPSGELAPALYRIATQWHCAFSESYSDIQSSWLLWDGRTGDKMSEFHEPWVHCFSTSSVKWVPWSEATQCRIPWQWDILLAHRWLFWQKHCVQGRQVYIQSVCSGKNKMLPLPWIFVRFISHSWTHKYICFFPSLVFWDSHYVYVDLVDSIP